MKHAEKNKRKKKKKEKLYMRDINKFILQIF